MGIRDRVSDLRTMRDLFNDAETRARRDGRSAAAAEDLLLAAVDADEGSGRAALAAVGVTPGALADAIRDVHAAALPAETADGIPDDALPGQGPPRGPFPSTGSFQELFTEVQRRVRGAGSRLHGAWFVLVASEQRRGTTARALDHLGVDRATLASAAMEALDRA